VTLGDADFRKSPMKMIYRKFTHTMRGRTKAAHPPNVRVPHDEELRLFEMHNFRGPVCSAPALNAS